MKCSLCLVDKDESEFNFCKHNKKLHKKCKSCFNKKALSEEEYLKLFRLQEGKCAICNEESKIVSKHGKVFKLCVDHDHTTGQARSLLCYDCNIGLGRFKDSYYLLDKASNYLKSHEIL